MHVFLPASMRHIHINIFLNNFVITCPSVPPSPCRDPIINNKTTLNTTLRKILWTSQISGFFLGLYISRLFIYSVYHYTYKRNFNSLFFSSMFSLCGCLQYSSGLCTLLIKVMYIQITIVVHSSGTGCDVHLCSCGDFSFSPPRRCGTVHRSPLPAYPFVILCAFKPLFNCTCHSALGGCEELILPLWRACAPPAVGWANWNPAAASFSTSA